MSDYAPVVHDKSYQAGLLTRGAQREKFRGKLLVYENEIKLKMWGNDPVGGGDRGAVKGFSGQSRKRFIQKLNRLHWPIDRDAYFVSLTYPDEFREDWKATKRDLRLLRQRLTRALPDSAAIWRIELKKRKMGRNAGKLAPHFHLFFFTAAPLEAVNAIIAHHWHDLVRSNDWSPPLAMGVDAADHHWKHGTDVKAITSRKHAQYYIGKYMSKDDDAGLMEYGRIWSTWGDLDFSPVYAYVFSRYEIDCLKDILMRWLRENGRERSAEYLKGLESWLGFSLFGLGMPAAATKDDVRGSPLTHILRDLSAWTMRHYAHTTQEHLRQAAQSSVPYLYTNFAREWGLYVR